LDWLQVVKELPVIYMKIPGLSRDFKAVKEKMRGNLKDEEVKGKRRPAEAHGRFAPCHTLAGTGSFKIRQMAKPFSKDVGAGKAQGMQS
jgi:hypothetical protein